MSSVISIRSLQRRNECRALSLMFAMAVNSGTRTTLGGAISSLTGLKKFDDLVVDAVDRGGEVLVADRRAG